MSLDYQALRTFADSWGLAFMVLTWVAFSAWTFRPGGKARLDEAANSIFDKGEETP